ncbi:ABC transporter, ATP-binding protein [Leptospira kirschneri str. 200803703]|uniref:ABC transporter, ATP-binding protein n=1 Tax=Leptospira kirschneri str. 200802841 TaxID=1193047 RepID=A0A828YAW3_9LEPT|nr:ABC transporter ATP-binding protein [Leptospira kirschneri]EMO77296.1 ABC transporter, ATP-binding protein [Leptospira kirschneri str. 200801925]EJO69357.1 ABC transporter, ATP-binding protein [Leptospira kirschneri serovar Grippotyphosa str. RM52]EKO53251.1 ABC transporter, ATP-binding protein [Leptospira kirschneri str. 200802841]EMK06175.1 ABC transporter, ATP-binding protein [Leptospira kirschneri str. MMD1493]EMK12846.1 ABC transporter, ATP-binding protein [Leptospira kirschneri serova
MSLKVENLNKVYFGFSGPFQRILNVLSLGFLGNDVKYDALKNVSFEVFSGEIVGLIGRNGAGKSTLLKVLTGVSSYSSGKILKTGSIRSILELGVGFNPELSGEENLYYNGLVWGLNPNEIRSSMDEIFEFSGLTEFKNIPIKQYSSGMVMRLGFALATFSRPDILIVDEALAVGDASFQQKCLRRFRSFQEQGTMTLIVSHDLELLKSVCSRVLILEKGKLVFNGDPVKGFREYMQIIASSGTEQETIFPVQKDSIVESLSVDLDLVGLYLKNSSPQDIQQVPGRINRSGAEEDLKYKVRANSKIFPVGCEVEISIHVIFKNEIPDLTVGFHIDDSRGIRVFGTNTFHLGNSLKNIRAGESVTAKFRLPLNFSAGKYSLGIALHEGDNHVGNNYLWKDGILSFELERLDLPKFEGVVWLPVESNLQKDAFD